jgi:hypothetical protein
MQPGFLLRQSLRFRSDARKALLDLKADLLEKYDLERASYTFRSQIYRNYDAIANQSKSLFGELTRSEWARIVGYCHFDAKRMASVIDDWHLYGKVPLSNFTLHFALRNADSWRDKHIIQQIPLETYKQLFKIIQHVINQKLDVDDKLMRLALVILAIGRELRYEPQLSQVEYERIWSKISRFSRGWRV